jgi:hypothetical protein
MPFSPKIPIAPGTSWDGRVGASCYWGKYTKKVKMCPHVKPGGGQCGLEAKNCLCMCLLCQAPMNARKRCGAQLPDGSICPWGQDRSPEVSSPEQDPPYHPVPRPIPWWRGLVPSTPPGRVPSDDPVIPTRVPAVIVSPVRTPIRFSRVALPPSDVGIPGLCLPNLEPGGPCGIPKPKRRERTPKRPKLTDAELDAALQITPSSSQ